MNPESAKKMPGNKPYSIQFVRDAVLEDLKKIPKPIQQKLKKVIDTRLKVDPVGYGKPLRYSLSGHRRLRVGDYRVVYRIEQSKSNVLILAIKHRKEVYKHTKNYP